MRILAAADIHGSWHVWNWLLEQAKTNAVDAVVLAGDLLGCRPDFDTPEDAQRFEGSLLVSLLETSPAPVLYVMGNDDLVELPPSSPHVRPIHGRRVTMGDFHFVGYAYTLPFMAGTFEKPEPGIEADLIELAPLLDERTIFVSHSPAHGILDPGFLERRIGSTSIRRMLSEHPFLAHIHGHSHAGFGREGKHFNVASGGTERAMILDLVTLEHRVVD